MPTRLIATDWNGACISNVDEGPLFEFLGMFLLSRYLPGSVAKAALKRQDYRDIIDIALRTHKKLKQHHLRIHPFKAMHLLEVKSQLKALLDVYRQPEGYRMAPEERKEFLISMYAIYNNEVVKGLPVEFIDQAVRAYARNLAVHRLDVVFLNALDQDDSYNYIISSGYEKGIVETLKSADKDLLFYEIIANGLESDAGKALGFDLRLYDNKAKTLKDRMDRQGVAPEKTVYAGHDPDLDGPCFELAGIGVVPPLASDEDKEAIVKKYPHARVPDHDVFSIYDALTLD